jgi:hypothetical protein
VAEVDVGAALVVERGRWRGVYVAEGLAPEEWPAVLQQ